MSFSLPIFAPIAVYICVLLCNVLIFPDTFFKQSTFTLLFLLSILSCLLSSSLSEGITYNVSLGLGSTFFIQYNFLIIKLTLTFVNCKNKSMFKYCLCEIILYITCAGRKAIIVLSDSQHVQSTTEQSVHLTPESMGELLPTLLPTMLGKLLY